MVARRFFSQRNGLEAEDHLTDNSAGLYSGSRRFQFQGACLRTQKRAATPGVGDEPEAHHLQIFEDWLDFWIFFFEGVAEMSRLASVLTSVFFFAMKVLH